MIDISAHVRIFNKNPTDDFVEKRIKIVKEIKKGQMKLKSVDELLRFANSIALGFLNPASLPDEMLSEIESIIKSESSAFVRANHEMQIFVCAVLSVLTYIEDEKSTAGSIKCVEVISSGLWSALSFQNPLREAKLEHLRQELLQLSQKRVISAAHSSRDRTIVRPQSTIKVPANTKIQGAIDLVIKATSKSISALEENAVLDREELNVLWWTLENWSKLLNANFSNAEPESAIIAAGLELSQLLRRLPTDAHKHLILKNVTIENKDISLPDLLKKMGDSKSLLSNAYPNNNFIS
ncbi:MAG: hypothetical protein JKY84_09845, partial [Emcibacteraceae bacterium]|nr:hypothetical protein [Emcibacteraceae bacterium]